MNLYAEINEVKCFSGEINTDMKHHLAIIDSWNHKDFTNEVPVGINMLLIRTMEKYLEIYNTDLNATRL